MVIDRRLFVSPTEERCELIEIILAPLLVRMMMTPAHSSRVPRKSWLNIVVARPVRGDRGKSLQVRRDG